jgi:hypothetical protein
MDRIHIPSPPLNPTSPTQPSKRCPSMKIVVYLRIFLYPSLSALAYCWYLSVAGIHVVASINSVASIHADASFHAVAMHPCRC